MHYSRFYHILETLVRYDYPEVKFKGRYRIGRYQSDYCIKTEVTEAFREMFKGVKEKQSDLILSYTNSSTNTIAFRDLIDAFCQEFNEGHINSDLLQTVHKRCNTFFRNQNKEVVTVMSNKDETEIKYEITIIKKPYNHSRMGRKNVKTIPVTEVVILAKYLL